MSSTFSKYIPRQSFSLNMYTNNYEEEGLRRSPLRVSPNQGPARRPMRGRLEANLDHVNIGGGGGRLSG